VTLSIGVASAQPVLPRHSEDRSDVAHATALSESGLHLAKDLVDRADQALYAAKTEGRDRVRVSLAD
jgi:GGDEF domain-containing protein